MPSLSQSAHIVWNHDYLIKSYDGSSQNSSSSLATLLAPAVGEGQYISPWSWYFGLYTSLILTEGLVPFKP